MFAVKHQELIEVDKTVGGDIKITQQSFEYGQLVSIYILPENIEALCKALKEVSVE